MDSTFFIPSLSLRPFIRAGVCSKKSLARVRLVLIAASLLAFGLMAFGQPTNSRNLKVAATGAEDLTNSLGNWIWDSKTQDRQTCRLWRSFEIPSKSAIIHSRLLVTADNEYTLMLDGRELGHGAEWRELYDYNITPLLSPGWHTLAVTAYNSSSFAGMIFGLRIDFADGTTMTIGSDRKWRIVPEGSRHWETLTVAPEDWPRATIVGFLGDTPWWEKPENVNPMPTLLPIQLYFWQTGWFQILLASILAVALIITGRLISQLSTHRKEEWLLKRERARIARDIHDDLGSRMTQLVLHGEVAQSELPPDSTTRQQIDRICEEARGVLSTMDEILWAVSPRHDTFSDFSSYVCGYAQEYLKPTQIQCLFNIAPEMSSLVLALPVRRALLMAIKESLNNAVKYSEASELTLRISFHGEKLLVEIADNGRGFDKANLKPGRNGFTNMAERIREVGGACDIASEPGKGCRIQFSLPLKKSRRYFWSRFAKVQPAPEPIIETKAL